MGWRFWKAKRHTAPTPALPISPPPEPIQTRVFVFGFDRQGFVIREPAQQVSGGIGLQFIPYLSAERLDQADGVIIPSGIFESIAIRRDIAGRPIPGISCDREQLRARHHEVTNLLQRGGWCCFLLGPIVDEVPHRYSMVPVMDTDLSKVVMNEHGIDRRPLDPSNPRTTHDEFEDYMRRWGIPETALIVVGKSVATVTLARCESSIVGLEVGSRLFLLPFKSVRRNELREIATVTATAIQAYSSKRAIRLPEWANAFQFESERLALAELQSVRDHHRDLSAKIEQLQRAKLLVVAKSDPLRDVVSEVLRLYFGVRLGEPDAGVEDLSVINAKGEIQVVIEAKGTAGGVKQAHVSQVEAHRLRRHLPASILGMLIINDFIDETNLEERARKQVNGDQIRFAVAKNVQIIRTVMLLGLMRDRESDSDRVALWNEIVSQGPGLLLVEPVGQLRIQRS